MSVLARGALLASTVLFMLVQAAALVVLVRRGDGRQPARWVQGVWTLLPALIVAALLYFALGPAASPGSGGGGTSLASQVDR